MYNVLCVDYTYTVGNVLMKIPVSMQKRGKRVLGSIVFNKIFASFKRITRTKICSLCSQDLHICNLPEKTEKRKTIILHQINSFLLHFCQVAPICGETNKISNMLLCQHFVSFLEV